MQILNIEAEIRKRNPIGDGSLGLWPVDLAGIKYLFYDLKWGKESTAVVDIREIDTIDFVNNSDSQPTQTWSYAKTTTATVAWSLSKSVSSQVSIGINIGLPKIGINLGGSETTQTTEQNSTSQTVSQTWQSNVNIPIPQRCTLHCSLRMTEVETTAPFNGKLELSGNIIFPEIVVGVTLKKEPVGIGSIFATFPHPEITVKNSQSIECAIEGDFSGIYGTKTKIELTQFPVDGGPPTMLAFDS